MSHVRRREFITLIGGAVALPFTARARQGERMRRIGVLMAEAENDPETPAWAARRMAPNKDTLRITTEARGVLVDPSDASPYLPPSRQGLRRPL